MYESNLGYCLKKKHTINRDMYETIIEYLIICPFIIKFKLICVLLLYMYCHFSKDAIPIFSDSTDSIKPSEEDPVETVDFKIVYNKQKHDVTFPINETVAKLKAHVQTLTG